MRTNSIIPLKISKKILSFGILLVLCLGITACKKADTISVVTETESQSQAESQTKRETQSQRQTQPETESQSQVSTDTETQKQTEETPVVIRNIKAVEEVMPKDFSFTEVETGKKYTIYDYNLESNYGNDTAESLKWGRYAFCDMDQDGAVEMLIEVVRAGAYYLILHEIEGEFYGYRLSYRSMTQIYEDGLTTGSSGSADQQGTRWTFTKEGISSTEEWASVKGEYRLYGETVSKEEYEAYREKREEIKEIVFIEF